MLVTLATVLLRLLSPLVLQPTLLNRASSLEPVLGLRGQKGSARSIVHGPTDALTGATVATQRQRRLCPHGGTWRRLRRESEPKR